MPEVATTQPATCQRFEGYDCPQPPAASFTWTEDGRQRTIHVCEDMWRAEMADLQLTGIQALLRFLPAN